MSSGKKIHVDVDAQRVTKQTLDRSMEQSPVELTATGVSDGPAQEYLTEMRRLTNAASDTYDALYRKTGLVLRNVSAALHELLLVDQELADDVKKTIASLDALAQPKDGSIPAAGSSDSGAVAGEEEVVWEE